MSPIQTQKHELLACMGGTFKGSQLSWTVLEKETSPIAHAYDKLEYLLQLHKASKSIAITETLCTCLRLRMNSRSM